MTRIVTDGAADLPGDAAAELGITVVTGPVHFGPVEWRGGPTEFWAQIRTSEHPPATAAPSVEQLHQAYEQGAVVAVHVSDELSKTMEHARIAAKSGAVSVVDSRSLSVGTGLVAVTAGQALDSGLSADRLARQVEQWSDQVHVHAIIDDVAFLVRGDRAGLLRAKVSKHAPRHVVAVRGHVVPICQVRRRKEAIAQLMSHVGEHAARGANRWAVGHGDADDVEHLVERLRGVFGSPPVFVVPIGPAVGTHVGPGALVVGFFSPR